MTDTQDWLQQVQADSLARLEAVSRMQRELDGLVGDATSPDRYIHVTVNPAGALVGLTIDDQARALDGEQLAAAIMEATSRAATDVAERVLQIVGEVIPADDLEALLRGAVPQSSRDEVDAELEARRTLGL